MNLNELEFHELADELPSIGETELEELAKDIEKNGLAERIVLLDGKILDGRSRYRALQFLKRKLTRDDVVQFEEEHDGKNPATFVILRNIRRRHLTQGQKAAVLVELKKREKEWAERLKLDSSHEESNSMHSDLVKEGREAGIPTQTMEKAQALGKKDPGLLREVASGAKTLNKPTQEARTKAEKKASTQISAEEHDKALKRIKEVCGKAVCGDVEAGVVVGLHNPKEIVAFATLKNELMLKWAKALYWAGMSWDQATRFFDRRFDVHGEPQVDGSWTLDEVTALMGKEERHNVVFKGARRYIKVWIEISPSSEQLRKQRKTKQDQENGEDQ